MAKTKISEFSSTPANNTDIDSINIAEGCAPSGINDAIRELMAQLKDFQTGAVGDSFNGPIGTSTAAAGAFTTLSATGAITSTLATGTAPLVIASTTKVANLNVDLLDGADWAAPAALGSTTPAAVSATTLSASSTVTLSGGTANGVAYLNGSKVVTSGSALTFDGTNLSSSGYVKAGTFSAITGALTAFVSSSGGIYSYYTGGSGYIASYSDNSATFSPLVSDGSYLAWRPAGTEQMRLTTTGLGIGTSSPATKLHVSGAFGSQLRLQETSGTFFDIAVGGRFDIRNNAGTTIVSIAQSGAPAGTQLNLDTSGNLGLGVVPSAWGNPLSKALEFNNGCYVTAYNTSGTDSIYVGANNYYNGTNYIYKNSRAATQYQQVSGTHLWFTAASGTAGNAITFTQAMTLTAGGKLFVNTTSGFIGVSNVKVDVGGRYNSGISGVGSYSFGAADGGGAFVINDTSNGSTEVERMRINSSGNVGIGQTSPAYKLDVFGTTPAIRLIANGVSNGVKLEQSSATGDVELNVIDGYALKFATSNTERARIDSSGNLLVGTTSQLGSNLVSLNKSSGDMLAMRNPNATAGKYWSNIVGSDNKLYVLNNSSTGVSIADGATSWSSFSDERMKDVIEPIADAANKVSTLRAVIGKYKNDADGTRRSFLFAQDVQAVFPEAVDASNPDELGLRYSEVIPLLVAAIQEQQAIINKLKARLDAANL